MLHSKLTVFDLGGLCDRTIARTPGKDQRAFHDYVFAHVRPTFIHVHDEWTNLADLDGDERFRRDYVPIQEHMTYGWRAMRVTAWGDFIRRDVLRGPVKPLTTILAGENRRAPRRRLRQESGKDPSESDRLAAPDARRCTPFAAAARNFAIRSRPGPAGGPGAREADRGKGGPVPMPQAGVTPTGLDRCRPRGERPTGAETRLRIGCVACRRVPPSALSRLVTSRASSEARGYVGVCHTRPPARHDAGLAGSASGLVAPGLRSVA